MDNEVMNVGQKLAKARLMFLNQKIGKSGKNMQLEFKYFELEDIVPAAIRIFNRLGLVTETQITDTEAVMKVYNTEAKEEPKTEKKKVGRPKKTENKVSSVVEPTKETEKKDKIEEIIDNSKGFLIKQEESVDTTDKTLQTKITRIRRTLKTK